MKKYIIFIFLFSVLTTVGQVGKIKIEKEKVVSDTINIIGTWVARPVNGPCSRVWEFKSDGTFTQQHGSVVGFYPNWPNGKYNFTDNKLQIFQKSLEDQAFNLIYTVEKKENYLLLTISEESKNTGPAEKIKLSKEYVSKK